MDFALPPVGEGLLEVELIRWLVKPGDSVRRGQSLMEVMSDKATMEVTATFQGTIDQVIGTEGTKVQVGQLVLRYTPASTSLANEPLATPAVPEPESKRSTPTDPPVAIAPSVSAQDRPGLSTTMPSAAPSVRYMARKLGLDLQAIRGSGPGGRVLIDDLSAMLRTKENGVHTRPSAEPNLALDVGTAGTTQKLIGLRRTISERMQESKRNIPHYSYIDECDVTDLVNLRGQLKDVMASTGIKLTYLPFIIKAVARALGEVPIVNSTFDSAQGEITLHDHYHIGFAVAAPGGLLVPVIHDADQKDVAAIARDIERLSQAARSGKIPREDLKGGTFTVTSIGNIGGLISTPIINAPEVGIMGVGKVQKRPVYDAAGQLRPAEMLYLSFSFDHRILDGAIGAQFGNAVIRHLQKPATLLLPERFGK